jgi:hypothetical protein
MLPWRIGNAKASSAKQPLWLWPNLLSLDAPLIAVLWLHLFAVTGHIRIPPVVIVILALVVWLIYVADRLSDGLRADALTPMPARHEFYRRHRRIVIPLLLSVLGATCWICFALDKRTFEFGALLFLLVVAYFAVVHGRKANLSLLFPKEIAVALVFSVGTFFPVWIHGRNVNGAILAGLALFMLTCWLNLVLIEYTEWTSLRGQQSQTPHATTIAAGKHLLPIGLVIATAGLCLSVAGLEYRVLLAISCSALALAALGFCWRKFSLNAVRVLADATLLTPALVLLFLNR